MRTILICLLVLIFHSAAGQYRVSGTIIDSSSREPLYPITAALLNKEGKVLTATVTDARGQFKLSATTPGHLLKISLVGYQPKEINIEGTEVRLDTILLSPTISHLEGVQITARKKLVEQKPGMLIYNAASDLSNKGGSAADVLRKAPVLSVDAQGNVSMRGSKNIKILIDGKYSGQMAKSTADALNMMPANSIASVEIITTPSAKYDAEGAAGVINIITKKDRIQQSGNIEAGAGNFEQVINPRYSFANKKWSISTNAHLHRLRTKSTNAFTRTNLDSSGQLRSTLLQDKVNENFAPHGSFNVTVDFRADSLNTFSFGSGSWFGNWPENNDQTTTIRLPDGTISNQYNQSVWSKDPYLGFDFSLGYTHKFRHPGRELNILVQTSPSNAKTQYIADQSRDDGKLFYRETNKSKAHNQEYLFQADYIHHFKIVSFEAGVKVSDKHVRQDYDVKGSNGDDPLELSPIAGRNDRFSYRQDIYAAYGILKFQLPAGWYVEAGTRVENTHLKGNFISQGNDFSRTFTNVIPTATISKKLTDDQSINASYTRRLTRPYIWDLNPNVNTSDPQNIVSGNPQLHPEMADQAELSHSISFTSGIALNSAIYWKNTNNSIEDFTQTTASGVTLTSKQNLAQNRQYGLNLSATLPFSSKLSMNSNINVNRLDFESSALGIENHGWGAEFNLNTTYKLPKRITVQAFGEYNTRVINLQGYNTSRFYYSFGARKEMPVQRLSVTLFAANPFSKAISQTVVINNAYFTSQSMNRNYYQAFKVTVAWEFGKAFEAGKRNRNMGNDGPKTQKGG